MSEPLRTLSSISRAVWRVPVIDTGFVQQTEALPHLPGTTDSRTGQPNYDDKPTQTFRVFLRAHGKHVEREGEKLRPILREALAVVRVDLPAETARMKQKISDESQLPPRPHEDDGKDGLAKRTAEWERKLAAMRQTAETIEKLIAWLEAEAPAPISPAAVQTPAPRPLSPVTDPDLLSEPTPTNANANPIP